MNYHDSEPHPICAKVRDLRRASKLSLARFEELYGHKAVVVGSYERGDRMPPIHRLDEILHCFGLKLDVVPIEDVAVTRTYHEMIAELRSIADQMEQAEKATNTVDAGEPSTPGIPTKLAA